MMFKKGSFEIDATIYPVAIKVLRCSLYTRLNIIKCLETSYYSIYMLRNFDCSFSMIQSLVIHSGIVANKVIFSIY